MPPSTDLLSSTISSTLPPPSSSSCSSSSSSSGISHSTTTSLHSSYPAPPLTTAGLVTCEEFTTTTTTATSSSSFGPPLPSTSPYTTSLDHAAATFKSSPLFNKLLQMESGGLPILLARAKENIHSTKDLLFFLKKRATMEEEYAKSMNKLVQSMKENIDKKEGKAGSYEACLRQMIHMHESIASHHFHFSQALHQMIEELQTVIKDTERSRKHLKESAEKNERYVVNADVALEKAKQKQETSSELWDKALQTLKQSHVQSHSQPNTDHSTSIQSPSFHTSSLSSSSPSTLSTHPGPSDSSIYSPTTMTNPTRFFSLPRRPPEKEEELARSKATKANEAYQAQLVATSHVRSDYTSVLLPGLLTGIQEVNEECDLALHYHWSKYAFHMDQLATSQAWLVCRGQSPTSSSTSSVDPSHLTPPLFTNTTTTTTSVNGTVPTKVNSASQQGTTSSEGIRHIFTQLNNPLDLQQYIEQHMDALSLKSSLSPSNGTLGSVASMNNPTIMFGVDLHVLTERENTQVPLIVTTLTPLIEQLGLKVVGLYRSSGRNLSIERLKFMCDRDFHKIRWHQEETAMDVHTLTGLLKLWFRSLPDSLIPKSMAMEFVQLMKLDDSGLTTVTSTKLIKLHELINQLPDANYATLRHFLKHLQYIAQHCDQNKMSINNLSIIFGPTLMHTLVHLLQGSKDLIKYQCKAIETMLENYSLLFEEE